jgi:hypothetical protein
VIDGNAIDDLSLVINLTKHIQTSSRANNDGSDLHEFFPSLLWVVRDFTLQLEESGKKITSRQYLDNALKPQGGFSEDATQKNQIRMLLSNFFRQRDCVTLVRPAEEESQLKNLSEQPYESLRPEFRKAFESMKKKLLKNIQPKMLYGNVLNGAMLANLAQTYTEAFNTGKAPVISSAWGRVVQTQCEDALEDALSGYKSKMAARIAVYEQGDLDPKAAEYAEETTAEDGKAREPMDVQIEEGDFLTLDEFGMPRKKQERGEEEGGLLETDQDEAVEQVAVDVDSSEPVKAKALPVSVSLPVNAELLRQIHEEEAQQAKAKLLQSASQTHDLVQPYVETLHAELWAQFEQWVKKNEDASMSYCSATLRHLNQSLLTKISQQETDLVARQVFHEACGTHDSKHCKMFHAQVHAMAEGCMLLDEEKDDTSTASTTTASAQSEPTGAISRIELDVLLEKLGLSADSGDGDGLSFDKFKDLCDALAIRENAQSDEFLRSLAACSSTGGDLGLAALQHYKHSLDAMVQHYYTNKARGPAADAAVCNFVGGGVMEHFISWGEQASERHVKAMARVQQRAHRVAVQLADAQGRAVAAKESFEQERQALADKYAETERRAATEREMLEKEIQHTDGELAHTKQHMQLLDKLAASAKDSTVKASQAMQHWTHTQGGNGPLHSGYLEKEAKGTFGTSWKTQYFVLAPAPHGLAYYTSKDEYDRRQRQKQELPLDGPGATAEAGADGTIVVVKCSGGETFTLKAASRGERDGWVAAIGDYKSALALAAAAGPSA